MRASAPASELYSRLNVSPANSRGMQSELEPVALEWIGWVRVYTRPTR